MATTNLRSLYRSLLRELPPRAALLSTPKAPLHAHIRSNFTTSPTSSSSRTPTATATTTTEMEMAQAENLAAYLRHQRRYVDLLERYNPGMNMDDEERVRLSARRVGMDMPVEFKDRLDG